MAAALRHTEDKIRQTVAAAQAAGEIDPRGDPDAVAGLVSVFQRGIGALSRQGLSRDELVARVDQLLELLN